jgi:hypothetical protein
MSDIKIPIKGLKTTVKFLFYHRYVFQIYHSLFNTMKIENPKNIKNEFLNYPNLLHEYESKYKNFEKILKQPKHYLKKHIEFEMPYVWFEFKNNFTKRECLRF